MQSDPGRASGTSAAKCSCWADGFAGFNADPNCPVHATRNRVPGCVCPPSTPEGAYVKECKVCSDFADRLHAIPNRAEHQRDLEDAETLRQLGRDVPDLKGVLPAIEEADATRNQEAKMDSVTQGPLQAPEPNAERKARAMLWQAVWETSQFCTPDEIRNIVEGTLREIESDEP